MLNLVWLWIVGCGGADQVDEDGDGAVASEDCDDGDMSRWDQVGDDFVGTVDVNNVGVVCPGYCRRGVDGDISLDLGGESDPKSVLRRLDCVTSVTGSVAIYGSSEEVSLKPLDQLTRVGGTLLLLDLGGLESVSGLGALREVSWLQLEELTALGSLEGLEELRAIPGGLRILGVHRLPDLRGLDGIEELGDVRIEDNPLLFSLDGFPPVASLSGGLRLENNSSLREITALQSLTSVDGSLELTLGKTLVSLDGLGGLVSIGGALEISGNDVLVDLSGLDRLSTIGDSFTLENCSDVVDLGGLGGLSSVSGSIVLDHLDSLTALDGIGPVSAPSLAVRSSPKLETLSGLEGAHIPSVKLSDDERLVSIAGLPAGTEPAELDLSDLPLLSDLTGAAEFGSGGLDLRINELQMLSDLHTLAGLTHLTKLELTNNERLLGVWGLDDVTTVEEGITVTGNEVFWDLSSFAALTQANGLDFKHNNCLAAEDVDALAAQVGETAVNEDNTGPCD